MTLKQVRLEANPTVSITNTQASKDLLGGATVINLAGGTQNLTPTGLDFVATVANQYDIARIPAYAPSDIMAFSGEFKYNGSGTGGAFVNATCRVGGLTTATAGVYPVQFRVSVANVFAPQDSAGATIPVSGSAPTAMVPGTFYRVTSLSNRTTGSVTIRLTSVDGTTVLGTWAKAARAQDGTGGATLGDGQVTGLEPGHSSQNQIGTITWHKLQFDDGRTTEIPVWVDAANQAPTAAYDAPRMSAAPGAAATATLTGTDPDGTITGYQHRIAYSSTTGATLANATAKQATLTAPTTPGSITVVAGLVKDNSGASSAEVLKEVCVPTTDATVFPLPNTSGGFNRAGSQTSDGAALASASDLDYLETPADLSTTGQVCRVRVSPMVDRSGTLGVTIRAARVGTSGHMSAELFEGTTSRGQLPSVGLTDTPTDYLLPLTATQVDSITDPGGWLQLFVEITFAS